MEIFPLDGAHGVDHVCICGGDTVGGGVCGVCDGGEWDMPLMKSRDARCGNGGKERGREGRKTENR